MKKKALMTASVASMIDLFNMDNIHILQELGYEVQVASNFEFGSITSQERVNAFRKELEAAGIRTYHIPIPRSISDIKNIIVSYRQLRQLCHKEQYEIVHTQSPVGGVVARLAARKLRKRGTRVIYTAHGFHFFHGAPKKNWLLFYPIEKYCSKYTDILITINQEDYSRAKKFHAQKVCYVPGIGIDTEKFCADTGMREELRRDFGFGADDFVVMSVGQLSKRKNQETVIRAMAVTADSHIKYLVVGLGECQDADQKLIEELGLSGRVILAGYRSDVKELLHMADCFVFPSLQEGLPVSLMEAMAAGVPVVCSRVRGNTDLVADGIEGRLVETMDVEGYAAAITEIKNDAEAAERYRRNAYKKIRGFTLEQVRKTMREIYLGEIL